MNHFLKKWRRLLPLLLASVFSAPAFAAEPQSPVPTLPAVPAGYARYVVVLWEPGTPLPGGGYMGRVPEPNFAALGGFVRGTNANQRLIDLPPVQATQVRKDPSVAYVQRLWMGEPMDDLHEEPSSPAKAPRIATEEDPTLTWGPKEYSYDGSGNITRIGTAGAYDNYTYDTAGRLIQATVGGKTESYQYDSFGNLVSKGVAGANATAIPVDGSSNRQLGVVYDAAGNMTARGEREVHQYDAFNMMTSTSRPGMNPRRMLYDANDERLAVISGGAISRWWFRDFEGQVLREYRGEEGWPTFWLWEEDYVYAEGQLVAGATIDWTVTDQKGVQTRYGGARHYLLDHLGSVRMVTNSAGRSVSGHDYFPFGVTSTKAYQEEIDWGDPQIDSMRYAGHQRDFLGFIGTENTEYLDYMHARYYDPNLGRFLSVDPIIPAAALKEPQRWNRYAYVSNNPTKNVDPTGKLLQVRASACSDSTTSCYTKLDAFQALKDWVGKDLAKYLQLGRNGQVTLKGISPANFVKFGGAAAIVGNLIRSTSSTAALSLSANVTDSAGRPTSAFTRPDAKGTLTEINPAAFPTIMGGATQTLDTAMAHDLGGHALMDMWGVSALDSAFGSIGRGFMMFSGVPASEAYAVTKENEYRATQGTDIREFYFFKGDYNAPPGAPKP